MEPAKQSDLQHVALPTACAIIYARISGTVPDPRDPVKLDFLLNDVALALSNLVPIYAVDALSGLPIRVNPHELLEGRFSRGAHAFTSRNGAELRGLTLLRRDMTAAIGTLRAAGVRFPRSES